MRFGSSWSLLKSHFRLFCRDMAYHLELLLLVAFYASYFDTFPFDHLVAVHWCTSTRPTHSLDAFWLSVLHQAAVHECLFLHFHSVDRWTWQFRLSLSAWSVYRTSCSVMVFNFIRGVWKLTYRNDWFKIFNLFRVWSFSESSVAWGINSSKTGLSESFTKESYHQVFVLSNISTLYCLILLPSCRPFRGLFRSIVHLNSFLKLKILHHLV